MVVFFACAVPHERFKLFPVVQFATFHCIVGAENIMLSSNYIVKDGPEVWNDNKEMLLTAEHHDLKAIW